MIAYSGYLKSKAQECYSSLKVKPNPSPNYLVNLFIFFLWFIRMTIE